VSTEAVAWALRADLTGKLSAEHRLVLVALADHASYDGTGAWPSKARLATRLGSSERSVQRALARLEALGLIVRGDQRIVSHVPANRRPTVWTLRLGSRANHDEPKDETPALVDQVDDPRGDTSVTPKPVDNPTPGETPVTPRGDTCGTPGETPVSPKPKTEPSTETPPPKPPASPTTRYRLEPCEHGQPGGADRHPRTGRPMCPLCRRAERTSA